MVGFGFCLWLQKNYFCHYAVVIACWVKEEDSLKI